MVVKGEEEDLSASSGCSVTPNIFPEVLGAVFDPEAKLVELRQKLISLVNTFTQEATLAEVEDLIDYTERRRHINTSGAACCPECGAAFQVQTNNAGGSQSSKIARRAYPIHSPTVKRPRGRPKKEITIISDDATPTVCCPPLPEGQPNDPSRHQEMVPIIKRSRGRPRKYPRKEPPAVRRGPGRPRKVVLAGGPAVPGRPRKLSQSFARDGDVELASDCSRGDESTEQSISSTNSNSPNSPKFDERFTNSLESMPISHLSTDATLTLASMREPSVMATTAPSRLFETDDESIGARKEGFSPNTTTTTSSNRRFNLGSRKDENITPTTAAAPSKAAAASEINSCVPSTSLRTRPSVTDLMLQSPSIDHEVRSSIPLHVVDAIPPPPLLLQKPLPRPSVVLKQEETSRASVMEAFGLKDEDMEAFGLKDEDMDLVSALRAFEMEMTRRNQASAEAQQLAS